MSRKRFQSRRGSGRFTRNTLQNCFGLRAPVCPSCRSFNPHGVDEPVPEKCHACGSALDGSFGAEQPDAPKT